MLLNEPDKLNKIEELKSKLFSKTYKTKIEHRDTFSHFDRENVPEVWGSGKKAGYFSKDRFFMKTLIFKNFFIFAVAFLILSIGYASYVFFIGGNTVSNGNIDISIVGNNFTGGGDELPLIVGIANKNSSALDLVDLVVEYPKGANVTDADPTASLERMRVSLGTIPAGAIKNENIKIFLFGEQGSIRTIKFSLEYRIEGSNAIFVKEKTYDVTINSTPLNITVDAPNTISPNQDMVLNIKSMLNATKPASKVLLKLDYPTSFQFESANPAPSMGNNVWSLGDLAPGAEKKISITGKMIDVVDGEEKTFHVSSGTQSLTDKSMIDVLFNSVSHSVTIKKPFIDARLSINGVSSRDYASDAKTPIHANIDWINNLDTKVNDLKITAKISGNAVNKKTINVQQGFYDSNSDMIIWDGTSQPSFQEVNPGESGSVSFSFFPVSLFSDTGGILVNPVANISISISGKQALSGYNTNTLDNSSSATVHIISDVGFAEKGLYYSGAFTNKGPIPPKVGKETTYTIVWSVSNTANNISKATIHSTLPSWMKFVGPISPADAGISFNPSTKEVVWNIGSIPRGTGINKKTNEASFQVSFTPSLSQVGATPTIQNDAILTGHDDFANVDVKVARPSLRTFLDNDAQFPSIGGTVVE